MKTATVNFKTEEAIKEQAFAIARIIGIPLGSILNAYLREFINSQEVHFSNLSVKKSRTVSQIMSSLDEADKKELFQLLQKEMFKKRFKEYQDEQKDTLVL